jgi:hypothetical protein
MFRPGFLRIPGLTHNTANGNSGPQESDNTRAPEYPGAPNRGRVLPRGNAPAFPGAQPNDRVVLPDKAPAFPQGIGLQEPVAGANPPARSEAEQANMRRRILAALEKRAAPKNATKKVRPTPRIVHVKNTANKTPVATETPVATVLPSPHNLPQLPSYVAPVSNLLNTKARKAINARKAFMLAAARTAAPPTAPPTEPPAAPPTAPPTAPPAAPPTAPPAAPNAAPQEAGMAFVSFNRPVGFPAELRLALQHGQENGAGIPVAGILKEVVKGGVDAVKLLPPTPPPAVEPPAFIDRIRVLLAGLVTDAPGDEQLKIRPVKLQRGTRQGTLSILFNLELFENEDVFSEDTTQLLFFLASLSVVANASKEKKANFLKKLRTLSKFDIKGGHKLFIRDDYGNLNLDECIISLLNEELPEPFIQLFKALQLQKTLQARDFIGNLICLELLYSSGLFSKLDMRSFMSRLANKFEGAEFTINKEEELYQLQNARIKAAKNNPNLQVILQQVLVTQGPYKVTTSSAGHEEWLQATQANFLKLRELQAENRRANPGEAVREEYQWVPNDMPKRLAAIASGDPGAMVKPENQVLVRDFTAMTAERVSADRREMLLLLEDIRSFLLTHADDAADLHTWDTAGFWSRTLFVLNGVLPLVNSGLQYANKLDQLNIATRQLREKQMEESRQLRREGLAAENQKAHEEALKANKAAQNAESAALRKKFESHMRTWANEQHEGIVLEARQAYLDEVDNVLQFAKGRGAELKAQANGAVKRIPLTRDGVCGITGTNKACDAWDVFGIRMGGTERAPLLENANILVDGADTNFNTNLETALSKLAELRNMMGADPGTFNAGIDALNQILRDGLQPAADNLSNVANAVNEPGFILANTPQEQNDILGGGGFDAAGYHTGRLSGQARNLHNAAGVAKAALDVGNAVANALDGMGPPGGPGGGAPGADGRRPPRGGQPANFGSGEGFGVRARARNAPEIVGEIINRSNPAAYGLRRGDLVPDVLGRVRGLEDGIVSKVAIPTGNAAGKALAPEIVADIISGGLGPAVANGILEGVTGTRNLGHDLEARLSGVSLAARLAAATAGGAAAGAAAAAPIGAVAGGLAGLGAGGPLAVGPAALAGAKATAAAGAASGAFVAVVGEGAAIAAEGAALWLLPGKQAALAKQVKPTLRPGESMGFDPTAAAAGVAVPLVTGNRRPPSVGMQNFVPPQPTLHAYNATGAPVKVSVLPARQAPAPAPPPQKPSEFAARPPFVDPRLVGVLAVGGTGVSAALIDSTVKTFAQQVAERRRAATMEAAAKQRDAAAKWAANKKRGGMRYTLKAMSGGTRKISKEDPLVEYVDELTHATDSWPEIARSRFRLTLVRGLLGLVKNAWAYS